MTYKTSDLFRRAKQLADLEGTDFISWNEALNCINESYVGLYEKLINMGDSSFVGSIHTQEKEIELPSDFWQLKGVYLWNNGNLQTINRRADNNGIHHLSYEMRNGKLFIFGNPNEILVEYYKKPKTLYMPTPDKEIDLSGLPEGAEILDCSGHLILYSLTIDSTKTYNIYDIDGIKTCTNIFDNSSIDDACIRIFEDVVITKSSHGYTVYDISTNEVVYDELIKQLVPEFLGINIPVDTLILPLIIDGKKFYWIFEYEGVFYLFDLFTPSTIIKTDKLNFNKSFYSEGFFILYTNSDFSNFWFLWGVGSNRYDIIYNDIVLFKFALDVLYVRDKVYCLNAGEFIAIDNQPKIQITASEAFPGTETEEIINVGILDKDSFVTISQKTGQQVGISAINENTGYGFITQKYGRYFVSSWCEDTVLDFPNSFYYQMLSYLLAISFKCKQGADTTYLEKQLAMISQTFEDTLGSDNFQYPRMGNVYN